MSGGLVRDYDDENDAMYEAQQEAAAEAHYEQMGKEADAYAQILARGIPNLLPALVAHSRIGDRVQLLRATRSAS